MAYRRRASSGYSRRSSGYGRRSTSGRRTGSSRTRSRARSVRSQPATIRLVLEQAPASGISRMQERVLTKMNPPPKGAKF